MDSIEYIVIYGKISIDSIWPYLFIFIIFIITYFITYRLFYLKSSNEKKSIINSLLDVKQNYILIWDTEGLSLQYNSKFEDTFDKNKGTKLVNEIYDDYLRNGIIDSGIEKNLENMQGMPVNIIWYPYVFLKKKENKIIVFIGYDNTYDNKVKKALSITAAKLKETKDDYQFSTNCTNIGMFVKSVDSDDVWINEYGRIIRGLPLNKNLKLSDIMTYANPSLLEQYKNHYYDLEHGIIDEYSDEIQIKKGNNKYAWLSINYRVVKDKNNKVIKVLGSFIDITDKKEIEMQLDKLKYIDPISELLNNDYFFKYSEALIDKAPDNQFSMVVIDIRYLFEINDMYGHKVGDNVIKMVGKSIKAVLGKFGYIARVTSDFFAFFYNSQRNLINIELLLNEIENMINLEMSKSIKHKIILQAGIAKYPDYSESVHTLYDLALKTVMIAKKNNMYKIQYYNDEIARNINFQASFENDLRLALENNEFFLEYQPKYDFSKNEVNSMEALVRWNHPTKGVVYPSDFIPIAEESGLIVEIGEWVMKQACLDLKRIQEYIPNFTVSVNVAPIEFYIGNIYESVLNATKGSNINPKYLHIEITESLFLNDTKTVCTILNGIKNLGVLISLDDFGTGYSSLSYLQDIPLDIIKIDRSFINKGFQLKTFNIISSVISLSKNLNLEVVCEGIETPQQESVLKTLGCDFGQGYLYDKSLTIERFIEKYCVK